MTWSQLRPGANPSGAESGAGPAQVPPALALPRGRRLGGFPCSDTVGSPPSVLWGWSPEEKQVRCPISRESVQSSFYLFVVVVSPHSRIFSTDS